MKGKEMMRKVPLGEATNGFYDDDVCNRPERIYAHKIETTRYATSRRLVSIEISIRSGSQLYAFQSRQGGRICFGLQTLFE